MISGTIFDVKRFALHDGQGVRTTLFLKGCPLDCPWCQNPEGISPRISLRWAPSKCIRCGLCVPVCPNSALTRQAPDNRINIDHSKCDSSGLCIEECPAAALSFDGRRVSAEDIAQELLKDKDFFASSGGGITLSGGEPLAQPAFAAEVLRICRANGVATSVETTLGVKRESLEAVRPHVDRFLVDQKISDKDAHTAILSADRNQIRENLAYLIEKGADILIRIALIPGYTATEENLRGLGDYIANFGPVQPPVELLNFNPLAENKYRILGRPWDIPVDAGLFSTEQINHFASFLEESGVQRIIT
jgi:glycyl-radical enzyme activating protein